MVNRQVLEFQSDRIEMVLASHKAPARVTGGVVTPRAVQFNLTLALGTKVNKLQALADELALALGVQNVRVSRQGSAVQVEIPRNDAQPVRLLPLMTQLAGQASSPGKGKSGGDGAHSIPSFTAALGLCDDGAPLLIRLSSPDVAHILISGTTGSGKTALCQAIILSLAMTHRRSHLQFVLIDPKRRAFAALAALPHLLWPIIGNPADAVDALGELVSLMEVRDQAAGKNLDDLSRAYGSSAFQEARARSQVSHPTCTPRIVVVLDELADLVQTGDKTLGERLTRLAQRGREAGIHVIACTQKPSSQVVGPLVRANFPVRLVGRVVSPEDARVAAGIGGTGAEKLAGRGDFVAVAAGQVLRFQAAFVTPAELSQTVNRLACLRGVDQWNVTPPRRSILEQAAALLS